MESILFKYKQFKTKRKLWKRLKNHFKMDWDISNTFLAFNFELYCEFFENHFEKIEGSMYNNHTARYSLEKEKDMKNLYRWWKITHPAMVDALNKSNDLDYDRKHLAEAEEECLQLLLKYRSEYWV